jgi:hypothetical protein
MCYINRATFSGEQEKKNPEIRKQVGNGNATPISNANGYSERPTQTPSTATPVPLQPVSNNGNAIELSRDAINSISEAVKLGLKKAETISLRLDAYDTAVELEEAHNATLQSRLTLDNVRAEWMLYAKSVESKLMRLALTKADLQLEGKILTVLVGSSIDQNNIKAELSRLTDTLRKKLNDVALKITVALDDSKMPDLLATRPVRPLTAKEKLDQLKTIYPLVTLLMDRFDLKLDD